MDYTKKKTHLLGGIPRFLKQHEKVWNVIHRLVELTASELLCTLQPENFRMFLNQLCVPEKRYRYERDSHESNFEYIMRTRIKSAGNNGLPGTPEHALGGYLKKTKCLMTSSLHTFKLLPLPKGEERGYPGKTETSGKMQS